MKLIAAIGSIGLCALLAPLPAQAQTPPQKRASASQQVPVDQLPAAITTAIQKKYPSGSIVTAYKATRGTETLYQLWVKETADAQAVVVTSTADGQLAGAKGKGAARPGRKTPPPSPSKSAAAKPASSDGDPIGIADLPKPVSKAIKDAYPKNTIVQAFKITTGGAVSYQIVMTDVASLQPMRVFVDADGTFKKR